jgi:hypothetical protein
MGICGIVEVTVPSDAHAETAESISVIYTRCQHAAGNRLSFHLQFRHAQCPESSPDRLANA